MFEERLNFYVDETNKALHKFMEFSLPGLGEKIREIMNYCLFNGGKRLRPVLALAICEAFGVGFKRAIPFACAVEFMHTGSLIHDDLPAMDDDDVRRNKPSCHVKFGEADAILAGDGFFIFAFRILAGCRGYGLEDYEIIKACEILSKFSNFEGMVLGQAMEFYAKNVNNLNCKTLKLISSYKTGGLFRAACILGSIAGKAKEEEVNAMDEFAKAFGLAFQIRDDILDEAKNLEKIANNGKEIESNFVTVCGLEKAKEQFNYFKNLALVKLSCFKDIEFIINLTKKALNF